MTSTIHGRFPRMRLSLLEDDAELREDLGLFGAERGAVIG